MARPRIFKSKSEFASAVDGYFASICYKETVTIREPVRDQDGNLMMDGKGHIVYHDKPVLNLNGEPIEREIYAVPPTIQGLCEYLGIGHDTWSNYAKRKGFSEIVTRARARIERFLEEGLYENPRAARGIMLNLTSNYGWSNRQTVEMGEETRKVMERPAMSMDDKEKFLREIALSAREIFDEDETKGGEEDG